MAHPRSWCIFACRTRYAEEVEEILLRAGEVVRYRIDNLEPWTSTIDAAVAVQELPEDAHELATVIPLLTPGYRFVAAGEARELGFATFPELVDPTSIVASSASLSTGAVVNAGAIVGAHTNLERFVHVNRGASIGHDNEIQQFATIGPGAVLAGSVTVERGAFLGAGAVCAPEIRIGANAVVGAGAVVIRDVGEGAVVVGNPARPIVSDTSGYRGVQVPPDGS